jgi:hypothetical protein
MTLLCVCVCVLQAYKLCSAMASCSEELKQDVTRLQLVCSVCSQECVCVCVYTAEARCDEATGSFAW